jgi:hypothetical protein
VASKGDEREISEQTARLADRRAEAPLERHMTEQRTPDELICEKLLGWKQADGGWIKQDGFMYGGCGTPAFTTWADAGLILEALKVRRPGLTLEFRGYVSGDCEIVNPGTELMYGYAKTWPLAIRAAALDYIRSLP